MVELMVQAHLGAVAGLIPDRYHKASITIKCVTQVSLVSQVKVKLCSHYAVVY